MGGGGGSHPIKIFLLLPQLDWLVKRAATKRPNISSVHA